MTIPMPKVVENHWRPVVVALALLVIYLYFTRSKTTKIIGTVDASGDGMSVNGE